MNKKNTKSPHEKPISIPLDFEDAVKRIISIPPHQSTKEKSTNENGGENNDG